MSVVRSVRVPQQFWSFNMCKSKWCGFYCWSFIVVLNKYVHFFLICFSHILYGQAFGAADLISFSPSLILSGEFFIPCCLQVAEELVHTTAYCSMCTFNKMCIFGLQLLTLYHWTMCHLTYVPFFGTRTLCYTLSLVAWHLCAKPCSSYVAEFRWCILNTFGPQCNCITDPPLQNSLHKNQNQMQIVVYCIWIIK